MSLACVPIPTLSLEASTIKVSVSTIKSDALVISTFLLNSIASELFVVMNLWYKFDPSLNSKAAPKLSPNVMSLPADVPKSKSPLRIIPEVEISLTSISDSGESGVNPRASVTLLELTPVIKSAISLPLTNAPVVEGSTGVYPKAEVTALELTPVIKLAMSLSLTNAPVVDGSTGVYPSALVTLLLLSPVKVSLKSPDKR